jgi:hypothetical protein
MVLNELKDKPPALGLPYTAFQCALIAFSVILIGVTILVISVSMKGAIVLPHAPK